MLAGRRNVKCQSLFSKFHKTVIDVIDLYLHDNYYIIAVTFLNEPLALHICTMAIPGIISIDEKARVQPNHSAHAGYT